MPPRSVYPSRVTPVQRIPYGEMHTDPGVGLRLHAPGVAGSPPNQVTDQTLWNDLLDKYRQVFGDPGPGVTHLDLRDPTYLTDLGEPGMVIGGHIKLAVNGHPFGSLAEAVETGGRRNPATERYWRSQARRQHALAQAAVARKKAFRGAGGPDRARQVRRQTELALREQHSPVKGLKTLLEGRPGVVIGGSHTQAAVWSFLIDNMAELKAAGVGTLYLESVRDDSYQEFVDQYLDPSAPAEMPAPLEQFARTYDGLRHLDEPGGLRGLLIAAKANGLRVRGIDGRPARIDGAEVADLFQRGVMMNTYAAEVIETDAPTRRTSGAGTSIGAVAGDGTKYLVEVGQKHTGRAELPPPAPASRIAGGWRSQRPRLRVANVELPRSFPGLDQLLGVPAVRFEDLTDPASRLVPTNEHHIVQSHEDGVEHAPP